VRPASRPVLEMFDPNAITIEEVYAAHVALVSYGFPSEIAAVILDFAEYWHQQRCSKKVPLKLYPSSDQFWEVSSLYLQTPPIGRGEGLDKLPIIRPRKVVFRLASRDRNAHFEGSSYENKQSWFDASIFREDESWAGDRQEPIHAFHAEAISVAPFTELDQRQKELEPGDKLALSYRSHDPHRIPPWFCRQGSRLKGGFKIVQDGEKPMWLLQRNRHYYYSAEGYLQHTIVWKREHIGDPRREEWPVNGSGSGINFVRSLERGDRIGIWAKVWGPCGLNEIKSVQVTVYYAIL